MGIKQRKSGKGEIPPEPPKHGRGGGGVPDVEKPADELSEGELNAAVVLDDGGDTAALEAVVDASEKTAAEIRLDEIEPVGDVPDPKREQLMQELMLAGLRGLSPELQEELTHQMQEIPVGDREAVDRLILQIRKFAEKILADDAHAEASLVAGIEAEDERRLTATRIRVESGKVFEEQPTTPEEKFRYVADFVGWKLTSQEVAMTPEAEAKIEQIYSLVEGIQKNVELREQSRVFSGVFDKTVETIREVIDGTSHWTGRHSTRLTLLAHELATTMWPFSSEYLQGLVQAGYLHDVGKILLPKDILDKDGALTDAEFLAMTKHASGGYELLLVLDKYCPWITKGTFHHENPDGKGYGHGHKFDAGKKRGDREPWGLKGAEISPIARALQAADVVDALLDFRPYKNGWTMAKVVAMLEQQAGSEFDPLVVAYLVDLYESRKLTAESYFHMETKERDIHEKFAQDFEYSAERNQTSLAANKKHLRELLLPQQGRGRKIFDPQDLLRLMVESDRLNLGERLEELRRENQELETHTAKGRDLYVDALFLLLKSVDARYEACGGKAETIGGQDRTENIIRYALMLAQRELDHQGITDEAERVEFLRQVALAAMFCDLGITKMDAEIIGRQGVLGVTDYKEITTLPKKGRAVLDGFLTGDGREHFKGADIGALEANLWANGEDGYGVATQPDGKPSDIGRIVSIAYKYTALRSETAYRANGLTYSEAMEAMRQNVGTEFDAELWKRWEELGAIDMLRLFRQRPEVVGQVKQLLGGREPEIVHKDSTIRELFGAMGRVTGTTDVLERIQLCLAAAKLADACGQFDAVERIVEMVEAEIVRTQDEQALRKIGELYSYDLNDDRKLSLELLDKRLEDASKQEDEPIKRMMRVHNALAVVSTLIGDYAEKGMVLEPELITELQEKILPVYKQCAEQLLVTYEAKIQAEDYDAADAIWRMFEQKIIQDLGDPAFTARVEATRQMAEQKRKETELLRYIKEQISEDVDPWNGEHYIALAHKLIGELSEAGVEISDEVGQTLMEGFYRKHYPAMFEQAQIMAEAGSVKVAEELLAKAKRWAELSGGNLPEEWTTETMSTAYRQGVEKMRRYLISPDLGLEDATKISRWLSNLEAWSQKTGIELAEDTLAQLRSSALAVLRQNLPLEILQLREKEDMGIVDVKRFWVTFDEYIKRTGLAVEVIDDKVETAISSLGEVLWQKFVEQELSKEANSGDIHRTDLAVKNFRKFCVDTGRDGKVTVRWEITAEQEQVMAEFQKIARQRALENRLANIQGATKELSVASSATPEDRIDVELRDWHQIAAELTDMGLAVADDELDKSVYGVIEERVMGATYNDKPATVALGLRKLRGWVDEGMLAYLVGDVEYIRQTIEPKLDDWFGELAEAGDLKVFQALAEAVGGKGKVVGQWYGNEILPSNYQQLYDQCSEKYLQMIEIQAQIYAIKSWLGPLRALQQEMGHMVAGTDERVVEVNHKIDVLAEGICKIHADICQSMMAVGPLMERALKRQREDLGQILANLAVMNTKEAQHDAELLKVLL
ncbi:MAG: HD domain-containing phosphohydrolase [Patescibacteria group bacterium]